MVIVSIFTGRPVGGTTLPTTVAGARQLHGGTVCGRTCRYMTKQRTVGWSAVMGVGSRTGTDTVHELDRVVISEVANPHEFGWNQRSLVNLDDIFG